MCNGNIDKLTASVYKNYKLFISILTKWYIYGMNQETISILFS